MLFTNISFLYYFLPVLIIIYFIMPKKIKNIILFLASMIFYFYGEPKYILLMILEILIAYIGGILIKKYKSFLDWILLVYLYEKEKTGSMDVVGHRLFEFLSRRDLCTET